VKKADLNALVLNAGLTSPGIKPSSFYDNFKEDNYLGELLDSDNLKGDYYPYFDIVNFHHYPLVYGNPDSLDYLDKSYNYIKKTLNDRGIDEQIWLTEIGYPDNLDSNGRERQAGLTKIYLDKSFNIGIQKVFYFSLWDHGEAGKFGIVSQIPTCNNNNCEKPVEKPVFEVIKNYFSQ